MNRVKTMCAVLALSLAAGCGASAPVLVQDVTVGLQAAICVLRTYSTDVQAGMPVGSALADSAVKCGVSALQASGIIAENRAAMEREAARKAAP